MILERKFPGKSSKNNSIYFHLSPTLSHFHPLQVENCGSNSRLVVDEDYNGKFRLERAKLPVVYITLPFVGCPISKTVDLQPASRVQTIICLSCASARLFRATLKHHWVRVQLQATCPCNMREYRCQ